MPRSNHLGEVGRRTRTDRRLRLSLCRAVPPSSFRGAWPAMRREASAAACRRIQWSDLGKSRGFKAVRVVQELALAADEQRAPLLCSILHREFFGLVGLEAAVVPGELDGRPIAPRAGKTRRTSTWAFRGKRRRLKGVETVSMLVGKPQVERPHGCGSIK